MKKETRIAFCFRLYLHAIALLYSTASITHVHTQCFLYKKYIYVYVYTQVLTKTKRKKEQRQQIAKTIKNTNKQNDQLNT